MSKGSRQRRSDRAAFTNKETKGGATLPGLPGSNPNDDVQKRASETKPPAPRPDPAQQARSEQAVKSGATSKSEGPEQAPSWKTQDNTKGTPEERAAQIGKELREKGQSVSQSKPNTPQNDNRPPSEQTKAAGQDMKGRGASMEGQDKPMDAKQKAEVESKLDSGGKNGQTEKQQGSRCDQARQQAASSGPSPSQSQGKSR